MRPVIVAILVLLTGFLQSATPAYVYRYDDTRLETIGEGVGDIVSVPADFDVDRRGNALVLLKIRVPAVREEELSVTGYGDAGRMPGPFRYQVMRASPDGGVTCLIDAGPGWVGENLPFSGLVTDERGIYLYGRNSAGKRGEFTRLRHYNGRNMAQDYDSNQPVKSGIKEVQARHAAVVSRALDFRRKCTRGVEIIDSTRMLAKISGIKGWIEGGQTVDIGPDPAGRKYASGFCIGTDDMGSIYLLMTRATSEEDEVIRRLQDLVVVSSEGGRTAVVPLKPWREDLWAGDGGSIRVLGDGTIIQLWSNGKQVSIRWWTR